MESIDEIGKYFFGGKSPSAEALKKEKDTRDLTALLYLLLNDFIEYFTVDEPKERTQMDGRVESAYTFCAVATLERRDGPKMNGVLEITIMRKPNASNAYEVVNIWFNQNGFDGLNRMVDLSYGEDRLGVERASNKKEANSMQYQIKTSSIKNAMVYEFYDGKDKGIFIKRLTLYRRFKQRGNSPRKWTLRWKEEVDE
jgi:hypothetical protein